MKFCVGTSMTDDLAFSRENIF